MRLHLFERTARVYNLVQANFLLVVDPSLPEAIAANTPNPPNRALSHLPEFAGLKGGFDFRRFWHSFVERIWIVALCVLAGLFVALGYLARTPKLYQGHTVLEVEFQERMQCVLDIVLVPHVNRRSFLFFLLACHRHIPAPMLQLTCKKREASTEVLDNDRRILCLPVRWPRLPQR